MSNYIRLLDQKSRNLIILKDSEILFESSKDGMPPLFEAINCYGLHILKDTVVVDRIVGKAAALTISYFKAKEVQCMILSKVAREVLNTNGIQYSCVQLVSNIMNKFGTDICPFEKMVLEVNIPEEGYKLLCAKLKGLVS